MTAAVQHSTQLLNRRAMDSKSWLLTKDHKRIAILYFFTITVFFIIGGIFAALIRVQLLTPNSEFMAPDIYNKLFTMHGVIMVFFFLIPSIPATFGNFFLPIMIGARDLAFPRINLLSWYLLISGGVLRSFRHVRRRRRYRLDLLHALQHHVFEHLGDRHRPRHLHRRLLLHPHRPELHRHRPPHARPRYDLVPHAAVRLGQLRHRPDPGPRHPCGRHHARPGLLRTRCSTSASSIPRWAAIPCCSSTCSGSTRTPPSTSWCCPAWASSAS